MPELIQKKHETPKHTPTNTSSEQQPDFDDNRTTVAHIQEMQSIMQQSERFQYLSAIQEMADKSQELRQNPFLQTLKESQDESSIDNSFKQLQIAAAEAEIREKLKTYETTSELEDCFEDIKAKYGLTQLEFTNIGEKNAGILIKVNPSILINLSDYNNIQLNGWNLSHVNQAGDVTFKTGTMPFDGNTYVVGKEMIASVLGPNHPQGGPPRSNALADLMANLPTDPKLPASSKYIKGHLLNDNIGGPGNEENLFPITATANREHEQFMEWKVKNWVNDKGHFVFYRVKVDEVKETNPLLSTDKVINAKFVCEVAKLDSTGNKTSEQHRVTINSTFQFGTSPTHDLSPLPGTTGDSAIVADGFDPSKVSLSSAGRDGAEPGIVDGEISSSGRLILNYLFNLGYSPNSEALKVLKPYVANSPFKTHLDTYSKMLFIDSFDYSNVSSYMTIGIWNQMINVVNYHKNTILQAMVNLSGELESRKVELRQMIIDKNRRQLEKAIRSVMRVHKHKKLTTPRGLGKIVKRQRRKKGGSKYKRGNSTRKKGF